MTDFRQIFDNRTNGGEWSIWSNMVSQMEIRIMTKISNSSPLSIKSIEPKTKLAIFKNILKNVSSWLSSDFDDGLSTDPATGTEASIGVPIQIDPD